MFFIDQSHFQEESWLCRPIVPSYCKAVTILLPLMIFIFQPIIVQLALSHGHFLVRFFLFLTLQSPIANFPTFTSRLDFTVLKSQRMEYYLRESVCDLCQVDENLKSLIFLDLLKIETFSTNLLGFSENVLP